MLEGDRQSLEPLFEVAATAAVWAAPPITREIDWSDVRPRLAELARRADAAEIFGAASHGWAQEPPLTTGELAELESQLGVELPDEYRSFLLEVSRGGAGPAYGLFPLRRANGHWEWQGDGASRADDAALTRPFGHIRAFNPRDDRPTQPGALHNEDTDPETYDDALHNQGLLNLCHLGCALYEALVLNGPSRGQMWADDTADGGGFHPLQNPDGSRMTFADWYRQWLNESTTK